MLLLAGFRPARSRWRRLVVRSKTWKESGAAVSAAAVARRRRATVLRRWSAGRGISGAAGRGGTRTDDVARGLGLVVRNINVGFPTLFPHLAPQPLARRSSTESIIRWPYVLATIRYHITLQCSHPERQCFLYPRLLYRET